MAVEFDNRWVWTYTGPRSWDDIGAETSWPENMDPMNPDVARALVYAAMERAEAVRSAQGYSEPMQVLRGAVAQCGPWEVPRLDAYNAVREAIRLMFGRFIDWDLTWQAYQDAWADYDYTDPSANRPTVDDVYLDYTAVCRDRPGLRIIGSVGSPRLQLASFCAGAYDALRKMRFVQFTGDSDRWTGTYTWGMGTGSSMAEAKADELANETTQADQFPAQLVVGSAGYVNAGGWDAAYYRRLEDTTMYTDPLYTTSPIDGGLFRPGLRLVRECTRFFITLNGIPPYGPASTYNCPLGWPQGPSYEDYATSGSVHFQAQVDSTPGHAEDQEGNLVTECFGFQSDMYRYADYNSDTGFLFKSYADPDEDQPAESESDNDD